MLEYCVIVGSAIDLASSVLQLQYNKQKKSVFGLSFDYTLYSFLHLFLSATTTLLYITNDAEYSQRYPVYPIVPASSIIILLEIAHCCVFVLLLLQLRVYKSTKNTNQGFSPFGLFVLGCLGTLFLWVFKMYAYKQARVIMLDLIGVTWFIGRFVSCVKFLPLVSMNWFDECVVGVFPDWWKFQLAVCGLQLLGKSSRSLAWWEVPVNFPTWIEVSFHLVCLAVIMYQVYIYKDNKSTLKAG